MHNVLTNTMYVCVLCCRSGCIVLLSFLIGIIVGFPYDAKTFQASDVGNATMKVFGTALQDFVINYVQGTCTYICVGYTMGR